MITSNLNEYDLYLFHNGTNFRAYQMLGAHFITQDGKPGVRFAVWAKNAKSVSVVGDFNNWDTRVHKMSRLSDGETWSIFIEGLKPGNIYKYAIEPQAAAGRPHPPCGPLIFSKPTPTVFTPRNFSEDKKISWYFYRKFGKIICEQVR